MSTVPTAGTGDDPNAGKTPPAAEELPAFDLMSIEAADTGEWDIHQSDCYEYSIRLPRDWRGSISAASPSGERPPYQFAQSGYQQGESAVVWEPNSAAKVDISVKYSPSQSSLRGRPIVNAPYEYVLLVNDNLEKDGRPGRELLEYVGGGDLPGLRWSLTYDLGGGWRLGLVAYFVKPYDAQTAAELRAIFDSITFD